MTLRTRLVVLIVALVALVVVVRLVRRRQMQARYLTLWVSLCVVLIPFAVVPDLLDRTSNLIGIYYPPAAFFLGAIALLFLIVIQFSWELSRLEERTRILAEELAFQRLRADEVAHDRADSGHAPPATALDSRTDGVAGVHPVTGVAETPRPNRGTIPQSATRRA